MPQRRDSKGRFALAPSVQRVVNKGWLLHEQAARLAQQRRERDLRTGLAFRRRCEDACRKGGQPGVDGERRIFVVPMSVGFQAFTDPRAGRAPETFEAMYVIRGNGRAQWNPILGTQDRVNARFHEDKIRRPDGPFARMPRPFPPPPFRGERARLVIKDDPFPSKRRIDFAEWERLHLAAQPAAQEPQGPPAEPWEVRPEDKPYDWWKRLPVCDDDALNAALDRACRRAHPHWRREYRSKEFRLALLGGGSFRDCFHALTLDGYDTGLIVKRPTRPRRDAVRHGTRLHNDNGNGQEASIYLHLADVAPEALACFPVLYETEPVYGDWAIHEKVRPESRGKEPLEDLEGRWRSAGVNGGDLHGGNIGRRDSDRCTLVIDYGHFTVNDLHSVEHRARR